MHGHGATPGPHTPADECTVILGDQGFEKGPGFWNRLRLESMEIGRQVCADTRLMHVSVDTHQVCVCMAVSVCDEVALRLPHVFTAVFQPTFRGELPCARCWGCGVNKANTVPALTKGQSGGLCTQTR